MGWKNETLFSYPSLKKIQPSPGIIPMGKRTESLEIQGDIKYL